MKLSNIELTQELSQNFIDFSYEANSQRAFADARDGLKPGQRACLWEMFDRGYNSNKPHVKSAKISGGVIANWWPHGDTAIYETFARMSQPWINNIPEVAWHGANGSIQISGEPAASRYTEARLSKESEDGLLFNIKKHNVNMKLNFSEDAEWPEVFPAIIPRLMINGCQGIGSTIANVWIPHSLNDLYEVIRTYVVEGKLDYSNLYPSFPTGGIIINKKDIHTIYETGKGKVIVRAKAEIKDNNILITEIPYQVYVEPLIEQIKKLAVDGTIEGIYDIHNKSDKKKLLIEIVCDGNPTTVLNKLFKNSDLEKSYSANQYALVGKTPKLLNLKQYLDIYLNHNYECIRKENEFELEKATNRLEIVDGLIKALEDIDNIIALIKVSNSSKDAVINLINKYKFTNNQAKAIVDMKLGRLAHLEKIELNEEKEGLTSTIKNCENIIKNISKQKEIFMGRLANFMNKYPCSRKTDITQIDISSQEKEIAYVEPEKCVVVTTESGLIKRIPVTSFKTQRRNGKGVKTADDIVNCVIRTNTIDSLMVFSNKGTMYRILVDNVPIGTNASKGVPIKSLIEMQADEEPTLIYSIYRNTEAKYVLFTTKNGIVKKTALDEYIKTKKKTGVAAITLKENDGLVNVCLVNEEPVIVVTKNGYTIEFDSKEISASGRTTMGVKGIALTEGDEVITTLPVHNNNDALAIFSENGLGKKVAASERIKQKRGGKGLAYYKPSETTGAVIDATLVEDEDNILIIGSKNSICISATDIPTFGRTSSGNILIKGDIRKVSKI